MGEEWLDNLQFDQDIKELKVPVYFIEGRYDYNVPSELVKKFCDNVIAPYKEYIEFENSAHNPNYEESERFYEEMVRIKESVLKKNPD
jgi:pimeloyl-ACP methyl ester carboxylesterase